MRSFLLKRPELEKTDLTNFESLLAGIPEDQDSCTTIHNPQLLPRENTSQIDELPFLAIARPDALPPAELEVGGELAKGGMGAVYSARQLPLSRDVVVKMVRPDKKSPKMTAQLLSESKLTGFLEHPNIVPVHQLGKNDQEQPMLVMKRIEGVGWDEIVSGKKPIPGGKGKVATLEWHVKTLIQVCHAVEYAHSEDIIHRDIKPSNVMIGEFGEVYLLDWGVAVSVNEVHRGILPLAIDSKGLAGSPSYMAPEMALVDGPNLGPHTDIYLLGAVLHTIITGKPPHLGYTLKDVLFKATVSAPKEYEASVPRVLASVCNKAMHVLRTKRFASAKDFREALEDFLRYRESVRLSSDSLMHFAEMEQLLSLHGDEPEKKHLIYEQFNECRFGFKHSLEIWPENKSATKGLQDAVERMIWYEIEQEDHKAASLLVAELPMPKREFQEPLRRLARKLAKKEAHFKSLQQMANDSDLMVGSRIRRVAAFFIGLLWGVGPLLVYFFETQGHFWWGHVRFLYSNFGFATLLGIVVFLGRTTLLRSKANRQLISLLGILILVFISHRLTVMWLEIPFRKTIILEFVIFFHFMGALAVFFDRRLLISALIYVMALFASAFWPDYIFVFMAVAHTSGMGVITWAWTPQALVQLQPILHPAKTEHPS